jgi:hypothetical protein
MDHARSAEKGISMSWLLRVFPLHLLCTLAFFSSLDSRRKPGSLAMIISLPLWQRPITDFFKTTDGKNGAKKIKTESAQHSRQQHLITDFFSRTTAFVSVPEPYW